MKKLLVLTWLAGCTGAVRPETPRCEAAEDELEAAKVQLVRAQAAAVQADKGPAAEAEEASRLNREAGARYTAATDAVKRCTE